MDICKLEQCTGCSACVNVCPHSAIEMHTDQLGFLYPIINKSFCVNCGLCKKVCPNNSSPLLQYPKHSYICYASNKDEQLSSTSGGIASVISRWAIRNGGVVYGCSAENCLHICHVRIDNERDIEQLKGSKYVQSDMGTIFARVKNDLQLLFPVVFIGTPCQVSGLRSFLRKDYDNLFTIDFVCHGVPSQQILNDELFSHYPKEKLFEAKLSFRRKIAINKSTYKTQYGLYLSNKKGEKIIDETFPNNLYITGFLKGLFYRESCYQCHYTKPDRISDLTLGDYNDSDKEFQFLEGWNRILSMMTVNTQKGERLLSSIKTDIKSELVEYLKLVSKQGQLRSPMKKHCNFEKFKDEYNRTNYQLLVKSLVISDISKIRKRLFFIKLRELLFTIPFIRHFYKIVKNK